MVLLIIYEGDSAIAADDDVPLGVFCSGNEDDVVVGDWKTGAVDDGDDGNTGGAFLGAGGEGGGGDLGAGGGGGDGVLGTEGGGDGGLLDEGNDGRTFLSDGSLTAAVADGDDCESVGPSEIVTWRDCKRFCSDLTFDFLQLLKVIKLLLFIKYIHIFL